eukprot:14823656-Alexandrium_andersonii.AAC.1
MARGSEVTLEGVGCRIGGWRARPIRDAAWGRRSRVACRSGAVGQIVGQGKARFGRVSPAMRVRARAMRTREP